MKCVCSTFTTSLTANWLMPEHPFHLAIPVRDIPEARDFYGTRMGLTEGRSDARWVDYDLYGHQLVVHLDPRLASDSRIQHHFNGVDGQQVPVPHFGVVLGMNEWCELRDRVSLFVEEFVVEPGIRFAGQPGEQATMFFLDPSGNALEFKGFADVEQSLFNKGGA